MIKLKIRGDIANYNVSLNDFEQQLTAHSTEDVEVYINSLGGDVFLGIHLCNLLRMHEGHVTAVITGIAASAASLIAMGADKIKMYDNAQMMIHNAWTFAYGNADELRKIADQLEIVNQSVVQSYLHRIDEKQLKTLLDDETYLIASDALKLNLADEIINNQSVEEVQSHIYENKAKEFNNQIKHEFSNTKDDKYIVDDVRFKKLEDEIKNLKQQITVKQAEQKPIKNKGFLFYAKKENE